MPRSKTDATFAIGIMQCNSVTRISIAIGDPNLALNLHLPETQMP